MVDVNQGSSTDLWETFEQLMSLGKRPVSVNISVNNIGRYFHDKVAAVCASTADATPPTYEGHPVGVNIQLLVMLSAVFIGCQTIRLLPIIRRLPD